MLEKIKGYHIILASGSPRRQELLKGAGFNFELFTDFEVEESFPADLEGKEIALYLAMKKSLAIPRKLNQQEILITADTVVCQGKQLLDKPGNEQEARATLQQLSGQSHHVHTGVCLRSLQKTIEFSASTKVTFGMLSEKEINYYIRHFNPFDKAGAYGIQEWIGFVGVEKISGSYFNVMGLPVNMLYRELENFIE
ncbi:MAG: Maf family nucleotide pyrophosphatase [Bacteroidales bacterium]